MRGKERWRRRNMDEYIGPAEGSARERSARTIVKAMKVLRMRQAKPSEDVVGAYGNYLNSKDAAEQWLLDMGIGFHLYRMYASDGTLLYIGTTGHLRDRLKNHYLRKPWIYEVAWIDTEDENLDESAAYAAEQAAIRRERPKYKETHNGCGRAPKRRHINESKLAANGRVIVDPELLRQ
jgi:predicted GIY-YIG superfamily endonuclease